MLESSAPLANTFQRDSPSDVILQDKSPQSSDSPEPNRGIRLIMSETPEPTLSFTNRLVLAGSLLLSFILGAAMVLFFLPVVGLERYTTGTAGQVSGIGGGFAGLAMLFAYISYQYYKAYEA